MLGNSNMGMWINIYIGIHWNSMICWANSNMGMCESIFTLKAFISLSKTRVHVMKNMLSKEDPLGNHKFITKIYIIL